MEIKEIKYLLTIASYRNISSAANALYVSQPSLSLFLKKYEATLGVRLFARTPTGVTPTTTGEIYLSYLREIAVLYQKAQDAVMRTLRDDIDTIRFGLPSAKSALYLPQILKATSCRFPDVQIDIVEANSNELEQRLSEDRLHLALISLPLDDPTLPHITIGAEEVYLAAPVTQNHLKRSGRIRYSESRPFVLPEDLHDAPLILLENGCRIRAFTNLLFSDFDIEAQEVYTVSNIKVALNLVAQGFGYTIVTNSQRDEDLEIAYFSIGPNGTFRDTVIAYSRSFFDSLFCADFTQAVLSAIQELSPSASHA